MEGTRFGRSRAVTPSDRLGTNSPLPFATPDINQGRGSAIPVHGALKFRVQVHNVELRNRLGLGLEDGAEETNEGVAGR